MADAPAKKTAAKKTAAKKTPAKKTPAKKATKKTARRTASEASPRSPRKATARTQAPPRRDEGGRGSRMATAAREAVLELTGKAPEAVTSLESGDDGWTVEVDVLELERIPSTTDVLATYRVTLDEDGELLGCRRVQRYLRGSAGAD